MRQGCAMWSKITMRGNRSYPAYLFSQIIFNIPFSHRINIKLIQTLIVGFVLRDLWTPLFLDLGMQKLTQYKNTVMEQLA